MSKIIFILGPTGSGKSDLAMYMAQRSNGIILNIDASQVYKQITRITCSPSQHDKNLVPHFLYNYVDLSDLYSAKQYICDACKIIEQQKNTENPIFIVGGSGFFVQAMLLGMYDIPSISNITKDYVDDLHKTWGLDYIFKQLVSIDPDYVKIIHPNDKYRILRAYSVYHQTHKTISYYFSKNTERSKDLFQHYKIIFLNPERDTLKKRCYERCFKLIDDLCIQEVKSLMDDDNFYKFTNKAIGIKEVANYILNKASYDESVELIYKRTKDYIKRQITWSKKYKNMVINTEDLIFYNIGYSVDGSIEYSLLDKIYSNFFN